MKQTGLGILMSRFTVLFILCVAAFNSTVAMAASGGDLEIYAPASESSSPTLMFMIESSTFMIDKDRETLLSISWFPETTPPDDDGISYKKYYANQLFGQAKYYSRLTRLKNTIFYLMNTEGVIPEDYKVGVGSYIGTARASRTETDFTALTDQLETNQLSAGIYIPAKTIGPVGSPHRKRIKELAAALCDNNSCLGEAPMAWAYAEAGAYMFGTKTAPLVTGETQLPSIYTLDSVRLRGRNKNTKLPDLSGIFSDNEWEICPENKQVLVNYYTDLAPLNNNYRLDCKEEDWVPVNHQTASQYSFGGNKMEWNCGISCNSYLIYRPHGIGGPHPNIWNQKLFFSRDISASELRERNGILPKWDYFIDRLNKPQIPIPSKWDKLGPYAGSGIRNSPIEVREGNSFQYQKPEIAECSGLVDNSVPTNPKEVGSQNAIIFFTAGYPRSAIIPSAANVMNMSFSPFASNTINTSAAGGNIDCNSGLDNTFQVGRNPMNNNWHCMGGYAKRLNSINNPSGKKIKTGVFLFAKSDELLKTRKSLNGKPMADCNSASVPLSVKNACLLGSENYGDGGFIQTTQASEDDSNESLADLINTLSVAEDSQIGVVPTDMPAVPQNPFNKNVLLKRGFLPLAEPDVNTKRALWQGNVRKYKIATSGFIDQQNKNPFALDASENQILSDTTLDFWSMLTSAYSSDKQAGGTFERLPYPLANSFAPLRSVYVQTGATTLTKLQPSVTAIANIAVSTVAVDKQDDLRRRLLNFLGFNISSFVSNSTDPSKPNTTDEQVKASADGGKNTRSHGAALHSKPIFISYKGKIDDDGTIKSEANKVVYGAMDGALHVVDETTGVEELAFVPADVLAGEGYKILSKDASVSDGPLVGVDASWISDVKYNYDFEGGEVKATRVRVYGGLRLGGKGYYGLDITSPSSPSMLFSINPSTSGFERMAYTWAEPVKAQIKWDGVRKDVLFVPAGYDSAYDETDADRAKAGTLSKETKGNAVYVIDASTGKKLITLAKDIAQCKKGSDSICGINTNMKYSIVGAVKVLDRDADDLVDHIYFADLGGQVFRADITNNRTEQNANVKRVIRIANFGTYARFYETPVVTIHNAGSQRFAVVSVASGDRSNPSFKNGEPDDGFAGYTNQVYAVFDKDVARLDLLSIADNKLHTKDVTIGDMTNSPSPSDVGKMLSTANERLDGWYAPLNRFENGYSVKDLKAFGPLSAVSGDLYVSVFNFHANDSAAFKCSAGLRGKTEANQFCLPYGYCKGSGGSVAAVNRQRFSIGRGIIPVRYTATDEGGRDRRIMTQWGGGSGTSTPVPLEDDGPAITTQYSFDYILQPARWFTMSAQQEAKNGVMQ